jgi:hypothetical protein
MKITILAMALLASVSNLSAELIPEAQVRRDYGRIKGRYSDSIHPAYAVADTYMSEFDESGGTDKLDTALEILRTGYFWGISPTK